MRLRLSEGGGGPCPIEGREGSLLASKGGGVAEAKRGGAICDRDARVGEAVAARGGGPVASGAPESPPVYRFVAVVSEIRSGLSEQFTFLLTHRFNSGSKTNDVCSPRFARTGPGPIGAGPAGSLLNHPPKNDRVCLIAESDESSANVTTRKEGELTRSFVGRLFRSRRSSSIISLSTSLINRVESRFSRSTISNS